MEPIQTAPKDRPILAWCEQEGSDPTCGYCGPEGKDESLIDSRRLCLYHGHAEGLSCAETGWHIIEWGGSWDDSNHEYQGGHMPDWWFVQHSEFEKAANPTHSVPLPKPPVTP
jgi:hypothetical protein